MKYYSTLRPVTPGSYPMKDKVKEIVNFDNKTYVEDIQQEAWGYIEYNEELDAATADSWELVPEGLTTWYAVTSSFYDNGKVKAAITDTVRAAQKPESGYKELKRCDVYVDYYPTKEEADKAVEEALKA